MNDGISILIALFIILMGLRWLMGTAQPRTPQGQRRPPLTQPRRLVTPEMVGTVSQMFPDIPPAAILADLQKTGSVEITCNNILKDGGLPLPPAPAPSQATTSSAGSSSSSSAMSKSSTSSLVHRYKLQEKIHQDVTPEEPAKVWESSADKRQEVLRKRKEFMVLQARKKWLEQQKKEEDGAQAVAAASSSSSVMPLMKPDAVDPVLQADDGDEPSLEQLNSMSPEDRRRHMLEVVERRRLMTAAQSSSSS
ncbi:hypothetical protein BC938DRAFT_482796 [Jimgerdemannia flammicorona]|uniref:CUE domain-containing protein n=1 Tax=Jimgerdemannia flammicorona TaxID=994334 RepID=A0A433QDC8_9FUNG|nr:hypothetical protein BC938DRAFT_482796 [Jimgerdemannia flammicorona]